ncbi:uncharacterized protein LOC101850473 [Aplysia californica]|uniref:Uncharacterized protein LOC101850473 n=1 Tax=Aplysia californica TaxID=6500 RepID=A0ABM1VS49_APLCA|nr:uncharacterized protein LOC101850473 [Aplysia californica]
MKAFVIVTVLLAMSGVEAFKLRSCSENPAEDKLRVLVADVNPDPVHLPGNFTAGGTIEIVGDYNGNYSADVKVTRELLWLFDVSIPCIDTNHGLSVGSWLVHTTHRLPNNTPLVKQQTK